MQCDICLSEVQSILGGEYSTCNGCGEIVEQGYLQARPADEYEDYEDYETWSDSLELDFND